MIGFIWIASPFRLAMTNNVISQLEGRNDKTTGRQ